MNENICSFKDCLLSIHRMRYTTNIKTFNLLLLFEISYSSIFNEMDESMDLKPKPKKVIMYLSINLNLKIAMICYLIIYENILIFFKFK